MILTGGKGFGSCHHIKNAQEAQETCLTDFYKKNYDRPDGFVGAKQKGDDHIHNHGDLIPFENFVTIVLPLNRETETPEPTRHWFAVADPRPFNPGDKLLVDLCNGKSSLRVVSKKVGRVLYLQDPLPVSPKMSGEVYKILGFKSTQIDTRFDLETGKGMDAFLAQEKALADSKQVLYKDITKDAPKYRKFK